MKPRSPAARWTVRPFLAALAVVVFGGCATVDPSPFAQFASSLQPLRSGSDTQSAARAEASRQDLIRDVAAGELTADQLQLAPVPSQPFRMTYGFAESEPNFIKFSRFRQGLSALNDAMIGYAQSLVVLAGGGEGGDILPTTAQFDQLARDLNANAGAAAGALGVTLDPNRQALLSAAAIQLFKTYIESKRRHALAGAIAEVQPQVEALAGAAQGAIRILASPVVTEYSDQVLPLAVASPPDAVPILKLNDDTQATLAALESLWRSYGALPAAHRDLAEAAAKKKTGLAGIVALGNEAVHLQGLLAELQKANTPDQ